MRHFYRYRRTPVIYGMAGIDSDVLQIFNRLDGWRQSQLFSYYEKAHGKGKGNYAKKTIASWASGTVSASGQTRKRLLELVPKVLHQSERYALLKKLYDYYRNNSLENHSLTVVLGHTEDFQKAVGELASRLCNKPSTFQLPTYIQTQISWVCDHDSNVSRQTMAAIEKEQSLMIARAGMLEVERLVRKLQSVDASVQGTHTIIMPYGRVSVHVRP